MDDVQLGVSLYSVRSHHHHVTQSTSSSSSSSSSGGSASAGLEDIKTKIHSQLHASAAGGGGSGSGAMGGDDEDNTEDVSPWDGWMNEWKEGVDGWMCI